ncbi:DHA2 family efflux MFS transporter permease subunit [Herbiconiux moechotypicola]|uniref:DHA2 family efflux MFS transporter permease subunit n=1 Tax=Herbiconiux moechotypicola TaxID=637393 RepID=A0ABP5R341_9MICO|nr:MDR family MFS transporter [Herbiconiux moechotypicola]MCS5730721.1 DHA2 family efflux MFS transporter permease subunit [Herbiconiux moechotypicola]
MTERTAEATASDTSASTLDRRNKLVINLLLVSAFVVILNETIMGVAIPHLVTDLGITEVAAQWLSTAFMLTMAVVIPITGFLLQRFHTRPIFIAAMSLFSLGTLIAAAAPGFEVLLVGRVVQASGTAIMMPLLMTTVMTLVPPATRGRTMGNISIVISVAPALGPTISGLILSTLSWRWMFILVLPIAIGALVLGFLKVQNVTEPRPAPIDVFSIVLSAFGFGGLVYGLSNLGAGGADPLSSWLPLGVGLVALAAFVWRQLSLQRSDKALLDLRTFRSPVFAVAIVMMAISMMALFGTVIVLPFFLQDVLQLDALSTGLLLLPGGLVMGALAPVVGRLYDRVGARPLLIPGAIVVSGVLWGLTLVNENTSVWWVLAAHVALSAGLAFMFTPLFTSALGSLRPQLYSHGSAIIGTVQQLAGASGTALFIAVMASVTASNAAAGVAPLSAAAGGIQAAFLCGAIISLFGVLAAFFIRKPALSEGDERMLDDEAGSAAEGVPIGH